MPPLPSPPRVTKKTQRLFSYSPWDTNDLRQSLPHFTSTPQPTCPTYYDRSDADTEFYFSSPSTKMTNRVRIGSCGPNNDNDDLVPFVLFPPGDGGDKEYQHHQGRTSKTSNNKPSYRQWKILPRPQEYVDPVEEGWKTFESEELDNFPPILHELLVLDPTTNPRLRIKPIRRQRMTFHPYPDTPTRITPTNCCQQLVMSSSKGSTDFGESLSMKNESNGDQQTCCLPMKRNIASNPFSSTVMTMTAMTPQQPNR